MTLSTIATATPRRVSASLAAAERALDAGEPARALQIFEGLTREGDFLDAEIGQVRAAFAAGEVRKAVAYAELVAGENPGSATAQLWIAYLQDRTGQPEIALRTLDALHPTGTEALAASTLRAELLIERGRIRDALGALAAARSLARRDAGIDAMARRAAYAAGGESGYRTGRRGHGRSEWPAPYSQPLPQVSPLAAGNGVLFDGGRHALTTIPGEPGMRTALRNGLGQVRLGSIEARDTSSGVAIIRLDQPFPGGATLTDDALGSPAGVRLCFMFGSHWADPQRRSDPAIFPGLLFREVADTPYVEITMPVDGALSGSPVFDSLGRLIGLAAGRGAGLGYKEFSSLAVSGEALAALTHRSIDERRVDGPGAKPGPKPSIEELYERLAPAVVTVFPRTEPGQRGSGGLDH